MSAIEREKQDHQIEINITADEQIGPFSFDEDAMQQVLFNLLINSIRAIQHQGKVDIDVKKVYSRGNWHAQLSVHDKGPGIQDNVRKIFETFYTTKSSGSGLGLKIIRQIIEKHGGWIEVESQPSQGATFRLYLPL